MCGQGEIYTVIVRERKHGGYWGWKENKTISFIFNKFLYLSLCFPYGIDMAEKTGKGITVELSIKELKD